MFELATLAWDNIALPDGSMKTRENLGAEETKGARWHRSYVRKVLTSPAVVGTFTPHVIQRDPETRQKLRKPLEAIHHRFPARSRII